MVSIKVEQAWVEFPIRMSRNGRARHAESSTGGRIRALTQSPPKRPAAIAPEKLA